MGRRPRHRHAGAVSGDPRPAAASPESRRSRAVVRHPARTLDAAPSYPARRDCLPARARPGTGKTYTGARMIVGLARRAARRHHRAPHTPRIANLLDETVADGRDREVASSCGRSGRRDDTSDCTRTASSSPKRQRGASRRATPTGRRTRGGHRMAVGAEGRARLRRRDVRRRGRADVTRRRRGGRRGAKTSCCSATRSSWLSRRRARTPTVPARPRSSTCSAATRRCPKDRGLFLDTSWRMHPDVCGYVSEIAYEGRLDRSPTSSGSSSTARGGGSCRLRTAAIALRRPKRPRRSRALIDRSRRHAVDRQDGAPTS